MSGSKKSGRRKVPYNPHLKAMVDAKRNWSETKDLRPRSKGWHERGYLPHCDEPGLLQFVTFHLIDSYPASLRSEWEHLLCVEHDEKRLETLQHYLDLGKGECLLADEEIGKIVDEALRFHHGTKYELRAWVVMPNHVHVLFRTLDTTLGRIIGNWKEFTAKQVNRILGRKGPFWATDYWDTYIRNETHERQVKDYIENNPVGSGSVRDPKDWKWSSARWRDDYGRLTIS